MEELRAEFRWQVGYWKSRHADALKRNEQLTEELRQAKGQIRTLQDKLFGRKSEKSAGSDRSNELLDPEDIPAVGKKRGRSPANWDTVGVIIPIYPPKKSSCRCRRNRWLARIAGSRS